MQPIIEIANLIKRYGDNTVLQDLSLTILPGELLVVLGESGSGKSTLLRLIAGLELPCSGRLCISGADQANVPPHRRDIAVVFQSGNGYSHLTVRENLSLAAKSSRSSARAQEEELDRWIQELDLDPLLTKKLPQLSGGQSQRVAIARAFISGKSILLMDEPLAHLDQTLRQQVRDIIARHHLGSDRSIIYVTHDSEEAMFLASRIAVLAQGQIQQIGSPRQVYESPTTKGVATILGRPAMDIIEMPERWLAEDDQRNSNQTHLSQQVNCGIRPHEWQIDKIDVVHNEKANSMEIGLRSDGARIRLCGRIKIVRWLGDRWIMVVNTGEFEFMVTCSTECQEQIRNQLEDVAKINMSDQSVFGLVTASVAKARLKRFPKS